MKIIWGDNKEWCEIRETIKELVGLHYNKKSLYRVRDNFHWWTIEEAKKNKGDFVAYPQDFFDDDIAGICDEYLGDHGNDEALFYLEDDVEEEDDEL